MNGKNEPLFSKSEWDNPADWVSDTFALVDVVETVLGTLRMGNIRNNSFAQHILHELKWVRNRVQQMQQTLFTSLRSKPDAMLTLTLECLINQIVGQMEKIWQTLSQAILCVLKEPVSAPLYQARLETSLYSLSLSLQELHKSLRSVNDETSRYIGPIF